MSLAQVLADHSAALARAAQADLRADRALTAALEALEALRGGGGGAGALAAAREAGAALPGVLTKEQKGVGGALNRLGKAIDGATAAPDALAALVAPSVRLGRGAANDAVAAHLFRSGLFALGETFAEEAGTALDAARTQPFRQLHRILAAFRAGDLAPAIAWADEHGAHLTAAGSDLALRLHRLAYIRLLQAGRPADALAYARSHLSRFPAQTTESLGGLMTCLLFAARLKDSPYRGWVADEHRDDIERALTREYCAALGLAPESQLVTIVRCGARGVPNLLKAARVAPQWRELGMDDTLPVEIDVGRDCQFHSIFTCPVSREETTETGNVPMMLPCGHVLSKHSVERLSKNPQRFKCPYCPREQNQKEPFFFCGWHIHA